MSITPEHLEQKGSPPDIDSPMSNEKRFENGGLKRPFFAKEVVIDDSMLQELKSAINKPNQTVKSILSELIVGLGLIDTSAPIPKLIENKVETAYSYYTEEFWRNYSIRDKLDVEKIQEIHDRTEEYEETSALLTVVRELNKPLSSAESYKKNVLMDTERVVRILIIDEIDSGT